MNIILGVGIFGAGVLVGLLIGALCNAASKSEDYEERDL